MEFKRDHALQQKVGQSRWQIFTIGFLLFVFLLTTSSCKCDDQPLKDENARLLGENQNLSKSKTEQEGTISTLTTANTKLKTTRGTLIEDQLKALRRDIEEAENEKKSYGPPQGPFKDFIQKQIAARDKQLQSWRKTEGELKDKGGER